MKLKIKLIVISLLVVFVVFLLFNQLACGTFKKMLNPKYDPEGIHYANTVKARAAELLSRAQAREHYLPYRGEVYHLMTIVEQAYEHARAQRKNDAVTKYWNVMRNPEGNRLGKVMADWKYYDLLEPETVGVYRKWIDEDLQKVIELEEGKEK